MNKREIFDDKLATARKMLRYRESLFPENAANPLLVEFRRQFDLAEKIANKKIKYSKTLDEIDMGYIAKREIEDMDPEFTQAVSDLAQSLRELLRVR